MCVCVCVCACILLHVFIVNLICISVHGCTENEEVATEFCYHVAIYFSFERLMKTVYYKRITFSLLFTIAMVYHLIYI